MPILWISSITQYDDVHEITFMTVWQGGCFANKKAVRWSFGGFVLHYIFVLYVEWHSTKSGVNIRGEWCNLGCSDKQCQIPSPLGFDRLDAQWPKYSPRLSASRSVIGAWPHLSLLQPIGPGEELLVWYSGEDNPEITAALEEERVSSLSKKNSPRAKRGEASFFHKDDISLRFRPGRRRRTHAIRIIAINWFLCSPVEVVLTS